MGFELKLLELGYKKILMGQAQIIMHTTERDSHTPLIVLLLGLVEMRMI